jgi:hypothetical protein
MCTAGTLWNMKVSGLGGLWDIEQGISHQRSGMSWLLFLARELSHKGEAAFHVGKSFDVRQYG